MFNAPFIYEKKGGTSDFKIHTSDLKGLNAGFRICLYFRLNFDWLS